jgi:hypothetical protein
MAKAKERVFEKSAVPVPPGMRRIEGGNFPPVNDFEKNPVVQGIIHGIKTVAAKIGRKAQDTRIMTIADENGVLVSVWESAALEKLFDEAKPGMQVWIHYTGPISIKGRKQPMKGFECALGEAPAKKAK